MGDPLETQEILLGGDGKRVRANLYSCRMLRELLGGNGEVEQKVNAKAGLLVEEIRGLRRIEAKPNGRHLSVGDRRDNFSHFVETRDKLQTMVVEQVDGAIETVVRMGDHEVEITRDPSRSQHHQRHASHQRWLETEGAETLNDFTNRVHMVHGIGHFTISR